MKLYETLLKQLKKEKSFVSEENELKKWVVITKARNYDSTLIKLLLQDNELKNRFFVEVEGILVFKQEDFITFLEMKNYLHDSYTQFKNKIGLSIDKKFLKQINDVSLVWPFKDCVLEGGQSKETDKRSEIFFNEILAQDEITQLFEPKVLTNAKVYNSSNNCEFKGFKRDANLNKKRELPKDTITDNLIIKGNNLLALHSIKKEFAEKIKLIYIDPPYNTGNDGFEYNDNFNHSTWLTFMKNRLEIAKKLLKNNGVIFISIDDREVFHLKVLCDEIFGRENFLNDIIWNSTKSVTNTALISVSHTHTLVYFKDKNYYIKNRTEFRLEEDGEGFSNPDNDPRGPWKADPFQVGGWRPNQQYEIINPKTKEVYRPNEGCSWKNDYDNFKKLLEDNRIVFGANGTAGPQRKRFLYEAKERGKVAKTIWDDVGTTTNGTKHLKKLFNKAVFNNPKPETFIKRIIELATKPNDIVLDYHLGSGTTATTAHKMGRQYIGIEQMDYIETVTVERLKKVIEGEEGGISKELNWQGGGSFIYFELKKYNQIYIDKIKKAKNSEDIYKIWEEIKKHSFLNYNVDIKKQEDSIEDFKQLELEEQKKYLIEILDKNQLYVNLSSIDDKDFNCSTTDKLITKGFYNESTIKTHK